MDRNEKLKTLILVSTEIAATAFLLAFFFGKVQIFDPVARQFFFREIPFWTIPVAITASAFFLFFLPIRKGGWQSLKECATDWLPLIPAGLLLLIPFRSTPLPLLGAFLLTAWGCCRHYSGTGRTLILENRFFRMTHRGGLLVSFLLMFLCFCRGFYLQETAYHRLVLYYSDWGIYAEHYLKLVSGSGGIHDWLVAGGHWNGALNLLMAAAFLVAPSPETLFLINSAIIYSAVPLLYLLGRQLKLSPALAVAFGVLFVLTPVVGNQPLSLHYGFHPVNILPSCFLLFFLFRERKQTVAAATVFLFTLFVQETAAVFWFGYAIMLVMEKKYRAAAILGTSMLLLFLLLSNWAIPAGARMEDGNYTQMFHYSQLGNTPFKVTLSPFLRPMAFFSTLFAINNFEFILFLLLPFVFFLPYAPKLLIAGLPLLAGVCLQSSRELQNVVLQYGVELNCLIVTAALFGAAKLNAVDDRQRLRGALAAALVGVVALHLLAGISMVGGKFPFSAIRNRPDGESLISFLKSALPPGAPIVAPQRIRAQLLFTNPTIDPEKNAPPGTFYLLEAHENGDTDGLRRKLLTDPAVTPVTNANWHGYEYVVLFRHPAPVPPPMLPFLKTVSPEEFKTFGREVKLDSEEFQARSRITENSVQFLFRLARKTEGNFRFRILLLKEGRRSPYSVTFANGVRAVSAVEPGTAFFTELPLPEGSGETEIRVETVKSR